MKKAPASGKPPDDSDDIQPEYHFDYRKARPNRFAQPIEDGSLVVVLEPDIAQVFRTPESVKKVLRALIETMPKTADSEKRAHD
jgi:hypothetical protein